MWILYPGNDYEDYRIVIEKSGTISPGYYKGYGR
jgi:hypothetical protein